MKVLYKISILVMISIVLLPDQSYAQYATKKVRSVHQVYTDSLKNVNYDYTFPILGQGAYNQGFDIPYPVGVMVNGFWMYQGLLLDNMQLGVLTDTRDIPLTPIDFIGFGDNTNTSYSFNFRPDIWIFPFLNVYGLFGLGQSHTEVFLTDPIEMKSVVDQGIRTMGFGVMGAAGIGPMWLSVDANFTWNKPELLDKATRVNVLGIRLGHTFVFKNKPERNIGLWVGGMRLAMATETKGAIKMIDALPPETWDRADEIVADYWDWYNGLNPILDAGKIRAADEVFTPIIESIDNADGSSVIRYGMDKQTTQLWNGTIGMQFQLNKKWQFRTEAGLIGDRKSALLSVNYRFLL